MEHNSLKNLITVKEKTSFCTKVLDGNKTITKTQTLVNYNTNNYNHKKVKRQSSFNTYTYIVEGRPSHPFPKLCMSNKVDGRIIRHKFELFFFL